MPQPARQLKVRGRLSVSYWLVCCPTQSMSGLLCYLTNNCASMPLSYVIVLFRICPGCPLARRWAESLALHADKTWKPLLKTTYGTLNAEVNRGRWHMQGYPQ